VGLSGLLTYVSAQNLACFGDAEYRVELAPETVIAGPNNVGKSVMIAAFNFLRTNLGRPRVQWETSVYHWRDFETIVHRHDIRRKIQIGSEVQGETWKADIRMQIHGDTIAPKITPSTNIADLSREFALIWYLGASRADIPSFSNVGSGIVGTAWNQPISPDGSNVVTYLLERYTDRDERWSRAEKYLARITPGFKILKSPLRGPQASLEATYDSGVDLNFAYQGTGVQKALSTIAALVFSPEGSTIIVEEPEIHLHPDSQEALVDLFNEAVNDWGKQIIFTTHSWNMLLPFFSDIEKDVKVRGKDHVKAKPENFKLITFGRVGEDIKIETPNIREMVFRDVRDRFKELWG